MQSILGGSKQSGGSSSGGFNELPQEIKDFFTKLASQATGYIGSAGDKAFTPIPQTTGETNAINAINAGFTPNQDTLKSDIAMQMNPFDDSVINEINRQAGGNYSILKQQLNSAGQVGSNRGMLGANDIDLSRLNQIGTFKQGQFNTAMNNALNTLPALRMQDASNQLGAGGFQRNLALQTNTAPFANMQALAQILGIMPKTEGTTTSRTSGSSSNGIGSFMSALF